MYTNSAVYAFSAAIPAATSRVYGTPSASCAVHAQLQGLKGSKPQRRTKEERAARMSKAARGQCAGQRAASGAAWGEGFGDSAPILALAMRGASGNKRPHKNANFRKSLLTSKKSVIKFKV
jgi:hypothetical protein